MELVEKYSYFGLFAILLAEEGGVPLPVPGDMFIATTAALPNSNYFLTVITVVTATMLGSTILFTLARKFGRRFLTKYGKRIRITPQKVRKIEGWFRRYGGFAIVIGRLIPGLRILTPIVAGLFEVSYKTFWFYTAIAAFIWGNIYFIVGKFFLNLLETIN